MVLAIAGCVNYLGPRAIPTKKQRPRILTVLKPLGRTVPSTGLLCVLLHIIGFALNFVDQNRMRNSNNLNC